MGSCCIKQKENKKTGMRNIVKEQSNKNSKLNE